MDKYLKMADYFDEGDVLVDGSSLHDASGVVAKVFGPSDYANYVAHAINSHDELVAEVGLLRNHLMACATELGAMIDAHNVQNMDDGSWKYDHQTPWEAMQLLK